MELKTDSLKRRLEPKFQFLRLPILTFWNQISCILHNSKIFSHDEYDTQFLFDKKYL